MSLQVLADLSSSSLGTNILVLGPGVLGHVTTLTRPIVVPHWWLEPMTQVLPVINGIGFV